MSEHFVVKHYTEEEGPIIKGNGFDGLRVGDDRQDAEELVSWINAKLDRISELEALLRRLDFELDPLPEAADASTRCKLARKMIASDQACVHGVHTREPCSQCDASADAGNKDTTSEQVATFCRACGASIPHRIGEGRCPECAHHLPSDANARPAPRPCEMCGDAPCQGCNKCCGSKLGRDPEDGSCLGCG